jgi:uncharacterized protein (TIGR04255 family)
MAGERVHAAIVERIVDIHYDLPPAADILDLEDRAKAAFHDYPEARRRIAGGGAALHFVAADEKQIVQFRTDGYTFNHLEPYTSLDDDLPQIESTWQRFREIARPVQIRAVGLRFIHRISSPVSDGVPDYFDFRSGAPVFDETLELSGLMNQYTVVEATTGNRVTVTLFTQPVRDNERLILADIESSDSRTRAPEDWPGVREAIISLNRLTDQVLEATLAKLWMNRSRSL